LRVLGSSGELEGSLNILNHVIVSKEGVTNFEPLDLKS
jgi:hypothetical protein